MGGMLNSRLVSGTNVEEDVAGKLEKLDIVSEDEEQIEMVEIFVTENDQTEEFELFDEEDDDILGVEELEYDPDKSETLGSFHESDKSDDEDPRNSSKNWSKINLVDLQ